MGKEVKMVQLKGFDARDKVYALCVKRRYFTCGSPRQYDRFLDCVKKGVWLETLARMLWLCSSEEFEDYNSVYKDLYYTLMVESSDGEREE